MGNVECKKYRMSEVSSDCLHIWGRTLDELDPLTLFWTGSAVEVNVRGSELWVNFDLSYEVHESWIDIVLNGALTQRFMLPKGESRICVFRNMTPDQVKNVRIIKDTQPMLADDSKNLLHVTAVETDGSFEPVTLREKKIEFIGDSITTGEGMTGAHEDMDWLPMYFSAVDNYAFMVAEKLGAEYRAISQGGFGVYCGWDNNRLHNIPSVYPKVCGVVDGKSAEPRGNEFYDFTKWQPDAIVVNLGTNDNSGFDQPEFVDPVSGVSNQMHRNGDGSLNREDVLKFENALKDFLKTLRKCNPGAHILWAYGMLGHELEPAIIEAINSYTMETGDTNLEYVSLPNTEGDDFGSRQHPGHGSHVKAAAVLTERLKKILYS